MNTIYLLLFSLLITLHTYAQNCKAPKSIINATGMKISVKPNYKTTDNRDYLITFKVPTESDDILDNDIIECEGWMPSGAKIEKIIIKDVEGISKGSTWVCGQKNCEWNGGKIGCADLKLNAPINKPLSVHIKIEGLGQLYGISRWYNCNLKIVIPVNPKH